MRNRVCLAVVLTAMTAFGWLRSYEVLPTQAAWSGKADGNPQGGGVGELFTANFDSLAEVQVFAGDVGGGGQYQVTVTEQPGGEPVVQSGLPPVLWTQS